MSPLRDYLEPLPLIAILRGLEPGRAAEVGVLLFAAGFRVIEVPLNSPEPFVSIRALADRLGERALLGAGTVLAPEDVAHVEAAGGRLIVMPHSDPRVIHAAKRAGLICTPGVATPSEAFAALAAGADALKLFPAEALPPPVVKAWRAVLPPGVPLLPVGGITPDRIEPYLAAGASGFGLGSALFAPRVTLEVLAERARAFVGAMAQARRG
jgi:2-dehydro-3-deoxyphosphogalactonate aldolase